MTDGATSGGPSGDHLFPLPQSLFPPFLFALFLFSPLLFALFLFVLFGFPLFFFVLSLFVLFGFPLFFFALFLFVLFRLSQPPVIPRLIDRVQKASLGGAQLVK